MLSQTLTLPEDPEELRSFTARILAEVKAQAILIGLLRYQLAGHRAHRSARRPRQRNSFNWRTRLLPRQ